MDVLSDISEMSRPPVGIPSHELALHEALDRQVPNLFPPGKGRSVFIVREPELGFGRPDAIILTISATALQSFMNTGLRLPSLNAARSLSGEASNVTIKYARTLARDVERSGWSHRALARSASMVTDSVAVEAKISEWRRAIRQATGYRVGTSRAAILVPARVGALVERRNLESHGIGLLTEQFRRIQWSVEAPPSEISICHRAWLIELLLRGLESGTAHRSAASANRTSESRQATTRLR